MKKICAIFLGLCAFSTDALADSRALEDVIAEVNPSVVSIIADNNNEQALGAGIIISADGYVVTNAHVTEGAKKIALTTVDDEVFEAELVGADEKTDIALLKAVQPVDFKPATFADSENIRVGNAVFAIGNPFGLGNSVSSGIISAKERDIEKGPYDNFIQTDSAINQGNSGGPLFNMDGQIIGMNTAIFSTSGVDAGVGFAAPSNTVRWVAEQLKQNGKVVRGWLGMGVQKIRSTNAEQKNKLAIASMTEDSPAAKAGLQVGDVLEKVGDLSLKTPRHFSLGVAQTPPNTKLPVEVLRDGEIVKLEVETATVAAKEVLKEKSNDAEQPDKLTLVEQFSPEQMGAFPELNMTLAFDEGRQEFVVTYIVPHSEAQEKGISVGDRFNTVNNRKVFGFEDLRILIKESLNIGKVVLQFIGEDTVDSITLNLEMPYESN
ncbi:MAG: trypsin-like peptidase domain-containing protein [Alphaproteobacteria bacterium]|nr:trypsin-like peptidase domain-containing protein [Alphaproteobacteria bacterium]